MIETKAIVQGQPARRLPLILRVEGDLMVLLQVDRNVLRLVVGSMTDHHVSHGVSGRGPVVIIEIVHSLGPLTVPFSLIVGVQVPIESKLQAMGSEDLC